MRQTSDSELFEEDFVLESVSIEDLERARLLDIEKEEELEDFYLPPEKPLKFE